VAVNVLAGCLDAKLRNPSFVLQLKTHAGHTWKFAHRHITTANARPQAQAKLNAITMTPARSLFARATTQLPYVGVVAVDVRRLDRGSPISALIQTHAKHLAKCGLQAKVRSNICHQHK